MSQWAKGCFAWQFFPARNGLTKIFNLIQPILAPFGTASYAYAVILCWPAGRLERLHHKRSHNLADHAFPRREHDYTSALRSGRTGHQPPLDWDPVLLSKLPFMSTLLGLLFPPGRWTFPTVHTGKFHSVSTSHTRSSEDRRPSVIAMWRLRVGQWHLASLNLKPGSLINLTAPRPRSWMLNPNPLTTCHGMRHLPTCLTAKCRAHHAQGQGESLDHFNEGSPRPCLQRAQGENVPNGPIELKQPTGPCCQCH